MRSSLVRALARSASCLASQAICADWVDEVPDPDTVVADTKGEDELDTLARQDGVLAVFRRLIYDLSGAIARKETQEQREVFERYGAAMEQREAAAPAKYRI